MKVLQAVAALLATLVVLAVVTVGVATANWRRTTETLRRALVDGARGAETLVPLDSAALPPVVRRYLERSLPAPAPAAPIVLATLEQTGEFQMGEGEAGWRPFTATQHVRAYPPAFLWDAAIRVAPFLPVYVRDAYVDGQGMMKGAVAATVVVVDGEPTDALARGALYRFLAEAAWIPTRLLPGEGLTWVAVDDSTAEATLRDGSVEVSVRFAFDEAGDITSIFVPSRPREADGVTTELPWLGRFWGHEDRDGYRVPLEGQVAWVVDGVDVPYWRGRITSVRFRTGP